LICVVKKSIGKLMEDNNLNENGRLFSKVVKAGKRKYFFDVRETKGSDYYIIITESKRKFDEQNFVKQKLFLYKEDFNKFSEALQETIDFIKKELLPEYDFDEFSRSYSDDKSEDNDY
jgi:hypothetical protein